MLLLAVLAVLAVAAQSGPPVDAPGAILQQMGAWDAQRAAPLPPLEPAVVAAGRAALDGPYAADRLSPRPTDEQLAAAWKGGGEDVAAGTLRANGCRLSSREHLVFVCGYERRGTDGIWKPGVAAMTIAQDRWRIVARP